VVIVNRNHSFGWFCKRAARQTIKTIYMFSTVLVVCDWSEKACFLLKSRVKFDAL